VGSGAELSGGGGRGGAGAFVLVCVRGWRRTEPGQLVYKAASGAGLRGRAGSNAETSVTAAGREVVGWFACAGALVSSLLGLAERWSGGLGLVLALCSATHYSGGGVFFGPPVSTCYVICYVSCSPTLVVGVLLLLACYAKIILFLIEI
jgi:hypothetical protein